MMSLIDTQAGVDTAAPSSTHEKPRLIKNPYNTSEWVPVGSVQSSHGLKGAFKVRTNDEFPDWLEGLKHIHVWPYAVPLQAKHAQGLEATVTYAKQHAPHRVILLTNLIHTPEAVKQWEKSTLYIPRHALPAVNEPNTWREMDLVGLHIRTAESGLELGKVQAILSAHSKAQGADHDYLEVRLQLSGKISMIPFIERFILDVDLNQKTITVQGLEAFLVEENTLPEPKERKRPPRKPKK
ncbi:MAG: ribosome maturation factor RimM [Vampirovibrionales bacterium]